MMAAKLETDPEAKRDWLDEMVSEIDETFDFIRLGNGCKRQKSFIEGNTSNDVTEPNAQCTNTKLKEENTSSEAEISDDVQTLSNACTTVKDLTEEENQAAKFDKMVNTFEETFDADHLGNDQKRQKTNMEKTSVDVKELQNDTLEVKQETEEENHAADFDEMSIKIEEMLDIDHLGLNSQCQNVSSKEETSDDRKMVNVCTEVKVETKRENQAEDFVYREQGPAVIVEFVGGATMEMFSEYSLETGEFERPQLVTLGTDDGTIQMTDSSEMDQSSTGNNTKLWEDVLDNVINTSAVAAERVEPLKHKEKKKRPVPLKHKEKKKRPVKNKVDRQITCRHLHNELACNLCSFKGQVNWDIKRHMKIHSGNRPFACPFCKYTTCHQASVKVHIRIHTGEKPYACDECEYRTTQKCHLNTHMLIHTGEKPYKCKACGYKTNTSSHLKSHTRVHEKEVRYLCKQCYCSCSTPASLIRHTKKYHL